MGEGTESAALAFESEAALQRALESVDLLRNESFPHVFFRREVPVGGCIPDLVLVRFAELPSPHLWPTHRSFRHAFVVWLLRCHGRLRPETLAAKTFTPLERIEPVLAALESTGAVLRARTGALFLSPSLAGIGAEVVAVEAKLRRWRDALEQAISYAPFADRVLVAMDAAGTPRSAEALAEFRTHGVGLLAVGLDGVEWRVSPRRSANRRGPDWDYLVSSAVSPVGQTRWTPGAAAETAIQPSRTGLIR